MPQHSFLSSAALVAAFVVVTTPLQLAAQTAPSATPLTEADRAPVCMARAMKDVPQVRSEKRGQQIRVVTIERSAKTMEAKGFKRVECSAADLARSDRRGAWRDEICELASTGNEAVQNQLEKAYGERPAVLCASAEQVAGPWVRKSRGKPRE